MMSLSEKEGSVFDRDESTPYVLSSAYPPTEVSVTWYQAAQEKLDKAPSVSRSKTWRAFQPA